MWPPAMRRDRSPSSTATGTGELADRIDLYEQAATLRGIVSADFNGDSRPDIVAADPYRGVLHIFTNEASGRAFTGTQMATWHGARNLVADDFDGDGDQDLVIGGHTVGLRFLEGDGSGSFAAVGDVGELAYPGEGTIDGDGDDTSYDLTPVYTLRSFRPSGSALPKVAATHAQTTTLWILSVGASGGLEIEHRLFEGSDPNFLELHDFEIAPIGAPLTSGVPDLVTVSKKSNIVTVWRGSSVAPYFVEQPYQRFPIEGGPRAVEVADTDHDGWGELAIVVRNFDRALIFKNRLGLLEPKVQLPSWKSPRDLVMPDLDGDGCADVVVINRYTMDLKVQLSVPATAGGFEVPRQLYTTDGDPAGLTIADMNRDGRGDILQLHRASGDVSIRLSLEDGR